ncbi:hypothetical protein [Candidatus Viridilinea mediisalina]|uniref:Uncharacterized protein n=1 Tax=Candidatus Viridilinea mediisalina TaxID=2024553 RepID=A0A2A6RN07_9CHLR|nr:hypothetical protein [Candidatus Viridilinea mediisalina]PDW04268.1 hypothetical protein CJ255_04245 [Candidatus Viridilinea mediisalina]
MSKGHFTIPTRVYLSAGQRLQLQFLLRQEERELDDLLTELLSNYLDGMPEPPSASAQALGADLNEELRRRRQELRRLRPRLKDSHNPAPAWLAQMVADLEAEIARLERHVGAGGSQG